MLKDFIEDTKAEISDAIRQHRGLDISESTANRCLGEMNSIIFEEEPDIKIRLKDFLKLFYSNFYEATDILDPEAPAYTVKVFPEADKYHPEEEYPLVFRQTGFLEKKGYKLRIDNLRRFLADYQNQTNGWISANDIMNAEIVDIKMIDGGRYVNSCLEIRVRIV